MASFEFIPDAPASPTFEFVPDEPAVTPRDHRAVVPEVVRNSEKWKLAKPGDVVDFDSGDSTATAFHKLDDSHASRVQRVSRAALDRGAVLDEITGQFTGEEKPIDSTFMGSLVRAGLVEAPAAAAATAAMGASAPLAQSARSIPRIGGALGAIIPMAAGAGAAIGTSIGTRRLLPEDVEAQLQADAQQFPAATTAGGVLAQAPFFRVGALEKSVRELLANRLAPAAIGGGIATGQEINNGMDEGSLARITGGIVGGAALNTPTRLGHATMNKGDAITSQLSKGSRKPTPLEANASANSIALEPQPISDEGLGVLAQSSQQEIPIDRRKPRLFPEKRVRGIVPEERPTPDQRIIEDETGVTSPPPIKAQDTLLAELEGRGQIPNDLSARTDPDVVPLPEVQMQRQEDYNKKVLNIQKDLIKNGVNADRATAVELANTTDQIEFARLRQAYIEAANPGGGGPAKPAPKKSLADIPDPLGMDTAPMLEDLLPGPNPITSKAPKKPKAPKVVAAPEVPKPQVPQETPRPVDVAPKKTVYQYSVFDKEFSPPGQPRVVQIDEIVDGKNTRSTSIDALAKEGINLPPVPQDIPAGQYTSDQIKAYKPVEAPKTPTEPQIAPKATEQAPKEVSGADSDPVFPLNPAQPGDPHPYVDQKGRLVRMDRDAKKWVLAGGESKPYFSKGGVEATPDAPELPKPRATDEAPEPSAETSDTAAKRSSDFQTTGNYDVEVDGKIHKIFRDPEDGWWYESPETNPGHHTQNVLGFKKEEAIEALKRKHTKPEKTEGMAAAEKAVKEGGFKPDASDVTELSSVKGAGSMFRSKKDGNWYDVATGTKLSDGSKEMAKTKFKQLVKSPNRMGIVPEDDFLVKGAKKAISKAEEILTTPDKEVPTTAWDKITGKAALDKKLEDQGNAPLDAETAEVIKNNRAYAPFLTDIAGRYPRLTEKIPGMRLASDVIGTLAKAAKGAVGVLETNIRERSPRAFGALRNHIDNRSVRTVDLIERASTLDDLARKNLTKDEFSRFEAAALSGDRREVEAIFSPNPKAKELMSALDSHQEVMGEVLELARAAGRDVGELDFYFPRKLINRQGLLKLFGREESLYKDALRAYAKEKGYSDITAIPMDEKDKVLNNLVFGSRTNAGKPGFLKPRTIEKINQNMLQFYETTGPATHDYITRMVRDAENRRFFGKVDEDGPFAEDSTIGQLLREEYQAKRIDDDDWKAITKQFQAYFKNSNAIDKDMAHAANSVRKFQTYAYLADAVNAIPQYADVLGATYKYGPGAAAKGYTKPEIKLKDIKLAESNPDLADFRRPETGTGNVRKIIAAADKTYAKTMRFFLGKADEFGKGRLGSTALKYARDVVNKPESYEYKKLEKFYSEAFPEKWPEIKKSLQKGEWDDNTRFFVFNEVANLHPVDAAGRAYGYNAMKSPWGKLLYTLRSFAIKQLDVIRNDIYNNYKQGNPTEATANAVKYALLVGAGQQAFTAGKDAILNRDIDPEEYLVTGLLQLALIPRYAVFRAKQDGPLKAAWDTIVPGMGVAGDIWSDSQTTLKGITGQRDQSGDPTVTDLADWYKQLETIKYLPAAGRGLYWWTGKGAEKNEKAKEDKELGRKRPSTLDMLESMIIPPDLDSERE